MSVREYDSVNVEVDAKLNDASFFAGTEYYQLFDRMRVEDPVHWTESPDRRGYWSIFKHEDLKIILNAPETYSSERQGVMPAVDDAMTEIAKDAMGVGENVLTVDPPRHTEIRKMMASPFMPKALSDYEKRAKKLIGKIFDEIPDKEEIDLVTDLAVRIPMAVICDLLDLPQDDWDKLLAWGKMGIGGGVGC